jgi:tetratricopeptide (TPR) repeat protein
MKNAALILALLSAPSVFCTAQTPHQSLRAGDADFGKKDFKKSEENYRRAFEADKSSKAGYNLGNAIYNQKRYDEAIKQYDDVIKKTDDKTLKTNSLYNKGNAHFWKQEYPQAVDAYKNALKIDPQDADTKRNLALAQRFLKKQQEEEKKKQDQQQNKDNKDDKNKSDKDKQPQNPNDKDPQKTDNQQDKGKDKPNQPDQNPKQNPQEQAQQDLKKEEAKRMLQIMDDEERKVQQRLKKGSPRPSRSAKDW